MQPHRAAPDNPCMSEHDVLEQVLLGNEPAIDLVETLMRLSQTWDDLHDGDSPVTTDHVDRAFWDALVAIPNNAFMRQFHDDLQPLVEAAITDWQTANALEKGTVHDKHLAFGLRDNLNMIVVKCAYLIGGYQWKVQVAPFIRRTFQEEPLADYMTELDPPQLQEDEP